jgi:hypothetical protein
VNFAVDRRPARQVGAIVAWRQATRLGLVAEDRLAEKIGRAVDGSLVPKGLTEINEAVPPHEA